MLVFVIKQQVDDDKQSVEQLLNDHTSCSIHNHPLDV